MSGHGANRGDYSDYGATGGGGYAPVHMLAAAAAAAGRHADHVGANAAGAPTAPADTFRMHGNTTTMNLNAMLLRNMEYAPYAKHVARNVHTVDELRAEVAERVRGMDAYAPENEQAAPAWVAVRRLGQLQPREADVRAWLADREHVYVRAVAMLFLRFTCPPAQLWAWLGDHIDDDASFTPFHRAAAISAGQFCVDLLTLPKCGGQVLPRIPVAAQRGIKKELMVLGANVRARDNAPAREVMVVQGVGDMGRPRRGGGHVTRSRDERGRGRDDDRRRGRDGDDHRRRDGDGDGYRRRGDDRRDDHRRRSRDRDDYRRRGGDRRDDHRRRSRDRDDYRRRGRERYHRSRSRSRSRSRERKRRRSRSRSRSRSPPPARGLNDRRLASLSNLLGVNLGASTSTTTTTTAPAASSSLHAYVEGGSAGLQSKRHVVREGDERIVQRVPAAQRRYLDMMRKQRDS